MFTLGYLDDRKPVPKMVRKFLGKSFSDKSCISKKLFEELLHAFTFNW